MTETQRMELKELRESADGPIHNGDFWSQEELERAKALGIRGLKVHRAGKISLQHELWNQRDRIGARSRRSCDLHEAVSAGAVWLKKQAKTAQLPLRLPVQELHRQFRRLSPL